MLEVWCELAGSSALSDTRLIADSGTHTQVLSMVNNPHYLYRMTVLVAIANLAPVVSHDVLCNTMLPVVVSCSKDKVSSFLLCFA